MPATLLYWLPAILLPIGAWWREEQPKASYIFSCTGANSYTKNVFWLSLCPCTLDYPLSLTVQCLILKCCVCCPSLFAEPLSFFFWGLEAEMKEWQQARSRALPFWSPPPCFHAAPKSPQFIRL